MTGRTGPRFSRWAPAFRFHLEKVGTVSWYIRAWPRAHPSRPCQAGQLCNGRMLSLSAVQPTMVGFPGGHWGLCNSDVKGGMGGYSPLPSVSIFGCGCWDQQRMYSEINREHLLVTIQRGSMGNDAELAATAALFVCAWLSGLFTHKHTLSLDVLLLTVAHQIWRSLWWSSQLKQASSVWFS